MLVAALALAELALQVADRVSLSVHRLLVPPRLVENVLIADERLRWRGNPLNPEHDSRGYRNREALRQADLVILGDSFAYGPADPREAWPSVLARQLRRQAYNMALPAYGPAQSLLLLEDALALHPRLVIVAPYFGNDFYDAFAMVRRHPELARSVAPALVAAANELENRRPLATDYWRASMRIQPIAPPESAVSHLKLYGLARAVRWRLATPARSPLISRNFQRAAASITPAQREFVLPFSDTEWRTILTPRARGLVLDDSDPRIRVGFEAARDAILAIAVRCRQAGVGLLIVLTPTKETVFWARVKTSGEDPGWERLVANELRLARELKGAMDEHGIDYIDLLEPLRAARQQPFYEDMDGHFDVSGHALVGQAVADHLARRAPRPLSEQAVE